MIAAFSLCSEGENDLLKEGTVQRVLQEALSLGADFSELYVEDTEENTVSMTDGRIEDAGYTRKKGAGIRAAKGPLQAYVYTADLAEEKLLQAAHAAAAALRGGTSILALERGKECRYGEANKGIFSSVSNGMRIGILNDLTRAAKAYSSEIVQTQASYLDVTQNVFVANSYGVRAYDIRPRTRVFIRSLAGDGISTQMGYCSPGTAKGFDVYKEFDAKECAEEASRIAVTMLHAPECPAMAVPVVIGNGFGGVIFHEACGHALEATSVAKDASVFCGKLGQRVAQPCVTAIDDGTIPGEWGTLGMDDEGTKTRRNVLIEDGILKSYLIDRINGRRMGMQSTASSRRQGYDFAPTSRMTNTFIAPGNDTAEEMLATMGEGLYAKKMGGGSVNPMTGEFNFAVLEAYWVRDGKIITPVRGATLIGKGAEVLQRIDRVGNDLKLGQGMCGSVSGSIPTNVGQPTIRVSEIIVGGKGGVIA